MSTDLLEQILANPDPVCFNFPRSFLLLNKLPWQRQHAPIDQSKLYVPETSTASVFRKHALTTRAAKEVRSSSRLYQNFNAWQVDTLGRLGIVLRKPAATVIAMCKDIEKKAVCSADCSRT